MNESVAIRNHVMYKIQNRSEYYYNPQCITAGTLVPSSVNGDIAIQWKCSNFDPSQNPNPLTDYDKTLHN